MSGTSNAVTVTILCDTPYVCDVSALFGHGNKANRFHSTHGLPHVETVTNDLITFTTTKKQAVVEVAQQSEAPN